MRYDLNGNRARIQMEIVVNNFSCIYSERQQNSEKNLVRRASTSAHN
jgi:hypothetical protein